MDSLGKILLTANQLKEKGGKNTSIANQLRDALNLEIKISGISSKVIGGFNLVREIEEKEKKKWNSSIKIYNGQITNTNLQDFEDESIYIPRYLAGVLDLRLAQTLKERTFGIAFEIIPNIEIGKRQIPTKVFHANYAFPEKRSSLIRNIVLFSRLKKESRFSLSTSGLYIVTKDENKISDLNMLDFGLNEDFTYKRVRLDFSNPMTLQESVNNQYTTIVELITNNLFSQYRRKIR